MQVQGNPTGRLTALVDLRRARRAGRPIGLLLDFDGTLSEMVTVPDQARLHAACAEPLERLLGTDATVAVVSGRTVEDLQARLPFRGAWLSGVHGAQFVTPGGVRLAAPVSPALRASLDRFISAARELESLGVRLEDKRLAVAAHVRRIADPVLRRAASSRLAGAADAVVSAAPEIVTWVEGKAVIEVRSRHASKANAVRMLLRRRPAETFLLAMGDDTTDEDMFLEALNAGGTAVKVGDGPTTAPSRVADPTEVARLLAAVALELAATAS